MGTYIINERQIREYMFKKINNAFLIEIAGRRTKIYFH